MTWVRHVMKTLSAKKTLTATDAFSNQKPHDFHIFCYVILNNLSSRFEKPWRCCDATLTMGNQPCEYFFTEAFSSEFKPDPFSSNSAFLSKVVKISLFNSVYWTGCREYQRDAATIFICTKYTMTLVRGRCHLIGGVQKDASDVIH